MLLLFLLGVFFIKQAEGVTCWTCSYMYTETERDIECVDAPWNVTQGGKETICPDSRFCTTVRQWDYTLDAVRSFARLCSESMGNRCLEDTTFGRQDCFTTCHEELCNDHDGIPESAKKASGSSGGFGIGVDSGTDKSEGSSETGNGGADSGTDNGNGNSGNGGSDSGNGNGDSGTGKGNADSETGNENADSGTETRSDGSSSGSNGGNGSSRNGTSDGDGSNSVYIERKKTPPPLPLWDDAWNYKERSGRSSHGGADAVSSFLSLICFLSLVCLLL